VGGARGEAALYKDECFWLYKGTSGVEASKVIRGVNNLTRILFKIEKDGTMREVGKIGNHDFFVWLPKNPDDLRKWAECGTSTTRLSF